MPIPIRQLFAIIPAAGLSRRMGQPKLLLPLGGKTILYRLLETLVHIPQITQTVVVIRPDDFALKEEIEKTSALLIQPSTAPPEMRESVTIAIDEITKKFSPTNADSWLLIPADHPVLDRSILENLIDQWEVTTAPIMVPTYKGKKGHPTFFRWELTKEIDSIPANQGLNYLVAKHAAMLKEVPVKNPAVITDIDTPEDYENLCNRYS